MPTNDGQFILDTDASDIGLGAVLSQIQDGDEKVIAYASRTLQKPEKNYETTRKELLAVKFGLQQFRQYLLGRPIIIRVDHAALSWLRRTAEPLPQLARWLTLFEQYDYTVVHRPGTKHGNADGLSRRRDPEADDAEIEQFRVNVIQSADDSLGLPEVGDPLAGENLAKAQQEDDEIGPIVKLLLQKAEKPPIEDLLATSEQTKILWNQWDRLQVRQGKLYRQYYGKNGQQDALQLLIPSSRKEEAIRRCHAGMAGGHLGTKKTLDQVQRRFFWNKWRADTARYCKRCPECCSYHRGKLPRTAPLQPIITGAPFERLSIDLTGPHSKSTNGHIWILTCVDPFTKWVEAFPLRNKEAETVAKVLVEQVFTRFGVPLSLLSDNGGEVDGNIMRSVCRLLDIDKLHTTAYKASTNAAIERFHKTMNSMLGKVVADHQRDWDTRLSFVMAAYRASRHNSTGYSPNLLTLGREARAPVDVVLDLPDPNGPHETYDSYVEKLQSRMKEAYIHVRQEIGHAAERNKRYYDLRVRPRKYEVGDWVYYFNPRHYKGRQDKWSRKYSGPFLVVAVTSSVNVIIQRSPKAKKFVVHIDKVKPFLSETPTSWLANTADPVSIVPARSDVDQPAAAQNLDNSVPTEPEGETPDEETTVENRPDSPISPLFIEPEVRDCVNFEGGSSPGNTQDFAVDEGIEPRPRRQIRLPARYKD